MDSPLQNDRLSGVGVESGPPPVNQKRKHILALDGLRGVAILLVLFRHSFQDYPPEPYLGLRSFYHNLAGSTGYGVVLFFVLSGFLITGILLDSKSSPEYYRSFFGRRILRIFPLYYGTILVFWLAAKFHGFAGDVLFLHRLPWLLTYTTNIVITVRRDWSFVFGRYSLSHFWSLAVEEQFYLLWPTVVLWSSSATLRRISLLAIPLSFFVRAMLLHGFSNLLGTIVFLPAQVDALAMGAYVAILVREQEELASRMAWNLVVLGGLILLASCFDGNLLLTAGMSGFGILSAGLLLVCLYHRPAVWFSHPVLRAYGKYSYGIYVLHVILLPYVLFLRLPLGRAGFTLFVSIISFAAAWLSWHLYEVHFLRLKRFFPADLSHAWHPRLRRGEPSMPAPVPAPAGAMLMERRGEP